jgi:hypothetical protein
MGLTRGILCYWFFVRRVGRNSADIVVVIYNMTRSIQRGHTTGMRDMLVNVDRDALWNVLI